MDLKNEYDSLYQEIRNFPETSRDYDIKISKFVSLYGSLENHSFFEQLDPELEKKDSQKGYFAFYIKHTYWRRIKKYEEVRNLEEKYRGLYGDKKSFRILHLRLEINLPSVSEDERLNMADNLRKQFPENSGVLHDFCMMVANIYELGEETVKSTIRDQYIVKCKSCIDKIAVSNYAKFLWTKARIYAILAESESNIDKSKNLYKTALESINRAWMKEELGEQYNLRVATYRNCELYIKSKFMLDMEKRDLLRLQNEQTLNMESFRNEISELKTQNLEIIGLFVAIISFTIGTFEITKQEEFIYQLLSIIILMGATLVIYAGLGITLHGRKYCLRNIIVILLGIAMIGGVIAFWLHLTKSGNP